MLFAFIPYIIVHYNLYGTIIPGSRASIMGPSILLNILNVLVKLSSEWSFGLIRFFYENHPIFLVLIIIVPILLYLVYKLRLFSKQSKNL